MNFNSIIFIFLSITGILCVTQKFICDPDQLQFFSSGCSVSNLTLNRDDTLEYVNLSNKTTIVEITGSNVNVFPPNFFVNFPGIQIMAISNANLLELNRGDFKNAARLTIFGTNLNNLTTLRNWTFEGCPNIGILGFTEEYFLTTLESGAFKGLRRLTQLMFNQGNLASLPSGIFDDLVSLNQLQIDHQKLKTLPINLLNFTTNLMSISFYNNQISAIPNEFFNSIKILGQVNLGYNLLTKANSFKAVSIDISNNKLEGFNITANTINMDVSNNGISRIGCIGNMSAVERMTISGNKLKGIQCISKMKSLTNLDLSNNKLSSLNRNRFSHFTNLRYLVISGNAIKNSRPRVFFGSKKLLTLTINKLLNYRPLRQMFPNLIQLTLNTKDWTCNETENVAKILRPQKISIQFDGEYGGGMNSFKCRMPSSNFN
jgi:Leucine-rich repeat (LRR) protein